MKPAGNLLLFNLLTDRDDPILGFTTEWINALAPFFNKIFVVTMSSGVVAVASNVEVYSVGKEQGYSEFKRVIRFYQILKHIQVKARIDVCFVHMISIFAILFFPVAMVQRIPILLWYCHGATSLTLRIAHQLVNRVITCSPEGFRLKSRKIKIIGHGINTEVFKPSGMKHSNGCRLLTVGRLSPVKHCDILIQAVKEVIAAGNKSIQYTIAGGPERSDPATFATYLRQLVDDNNLQDVIAFRGPVSFYDVPELYRDADLFLNASSTGSLDKAVLEAMSCGCVVLTSNPPYKTVFGDLADLLFVPQNHPADFAAAIKRIIVLSPQERTMIGNRLRNIVLTHHSLERLTSQIVHELESLHGAYRQ